MWPVDEEIVNAKLYALQVLNVHICHIMEKSDHPSLVAAAPRLRELRLACEGLAVIWGRDVDMIIADRFIAEFSQKIESLKTPN